MATMAPTRTPHPLQSGFDLGSLWLASGAIGILARGAIILSLPELGRGLVWVDGVLTPSASLLAPVAIAIPVLCALLLAQGGVRKLIDMHIPGRLLEDAPPSSIVPSVALVAVGNIVLLAAALYAATHSNGDHGVTRMMLLLLGVVFLSALPGRVLRTRIEKRPGWRGDASLAVADAVTLGVGLLVAGRLASPGVLSHVPAALVVYAAAVTFVISLFFALLVGASRQERERGRGGSSGFLRTFSDRIVDARVASPTLRHYETAHRVVVVAAVSVAVLVVVLSLAMNIVLP